MAKKTSKALAARKPAPKAVKKYSNKVTKMKYENGHLTVDKVEQVAELKKDEVILSETASRTRYRKRGNVTESFIQTYKRKETISQAEAAARLHCNRGGSTRLLTNE